MSINQYDIENGSFVSLPALHRPVHNIVNKLENEVARIGSGKLSPPYKKENC